MSAPDARIGVYVCHCGTNIAGPVDVAAVRDFAAGLPGVVVARDYKYMCADPGQDLIKKDIKELGVNRVIVASCSPRMHEPTFRRCLQLAGLNAYFFEMANIREQVAWCTADKAAATKKAMALVRGAAARVPYHEPLEERTSPVCPVTLIVGGGVAGIEAALKIASSGNKVWLVEREPSIGGNMARFDKTFPTLDCAACILTPKMADVGRHPNITLLTYSEVLEVSGFIGNFEVTIKKRARSVRHGVCTGCGVCYSKCPTKVPSEFDVGLGERTAIYVPFPQAVPNVPVIDREVCRQFTKGKCGICQKVCPAGAVDYEQQDEIIKEKFGVIIIATGFEVFDPSLAPQYGYGRYPDVYTALQFERMTNASGPTTGRVVCRNGQEPKAVAILHCIGSRDKNYYPYCSRVCCMASVKAAHLAKEKSGGAEIYEFYIDMRTFGKQYEEFYNRVQEEGVHFIRGKGAEVIEKDGRLVVHAEDTLLGLYREVPVDMVVLNTALIPHADAGRVAQIFNIQRSQDGFYLEAHIKLDPMKTATEGVYLAGACQSPKDIPDSVAQGAGAAAEALQRIVAGEVVISPVTCAIDADRCAGCRMCIPLCPYTAITFNAEKGVSECNEALCKGCGTCVASCASGAARLKHFDQRQLLAQIEGVAAS
jgi:heterodisulfide reductase subunit A